MVLIQMGQDGRGTWGRASIVVRDDGASAAPARNIHHVADRRKGRCSAHGGTNDESEGIHGQRGDPISQLHTSLQA